jgi:hypothetical protein
MKLLTFLKPLILSISLLLPVYALDERYNEDEIKQDMKQALGWLQEKVTDGYEVIKESYLELYN